jgi:hypothetical protein
MTAGFIAQWHDPDLDKVSSALVRAGQRARELARQTDTGIAVNINGELKILTPTELDLVVAEPKELHSSAP